MSKKLAFTPFLPLERMKRRRKLCGSNLLHFVCDNNRVLPSPCLPCTCDNDDSFVHSKIFMKAIALSRWDVENGTKKKTEHYHSVLAGKSKFPAG